MIYESYNSYGGHTALTASSSRRLRCRGRRRLSSWYCGQDAQRVLDRVLGQLEHVAAAISASSSDRISLSSSEIDDRLDRGAMQLDVSS